MSSRFQARNLVKRFLSTALSVSLIWCTPGISFSSAPARVVADDVADYQELVQKIFDARVERASNQLLKTVTSDAEEFEDASAHLQMRYQHNWTRKFSESGRESMMEKVAADLVTSDIFSTPDHIEEADVRERIETFLTIAHRSIAEDDSRELIALLEEENARAPQDQLGNVLMQGMNHEARSALVGLPSGSSDASTSLAGTMALPARGGNPVGIGFTLATGSLIALAAVLGPMTARLHRPVQRPVPRMPLPYVPSLAEQATNQIIEATFGPFSTLQPALNGSANLSRNAGFAMDTLIGVLPLTPMYFFALNGQIDAGERGDRGLGSGPPMSPEDRTLLAIVLVTTVVALAVGIVIDLTRSDSEDSDQNQEQKSNPHEAEMMTPRKP